MGDELREVSQAVALAELARRDPVTHDQIRQFRITLDNEAQHPEPEMHRVPHPDDITHALDGERLVARLDHAVRGKRLPVLELVRNVLVLVPVMFTWFSLSLASAAFQAIASRMEVMPGDTGPTMQQLWEQGFDGIDRVDWGLIHNIPLVFNFADGSQWRWFTFSLVAGLDAFIMLTLAMVVVWVAWLQRRTHAERVALQTAIDVTVATMRHDARRIRDQVSARTTVSAADRVGSVLAQFAASSTAIIDELKRSSSVFVDAADARSEANRVLSDSATRLSQIVNEVSRFAGQLETLLSGQQHTVQRMEGALTALLSEQTETRTALEGIASGVQSATEGMERSTRDFSAAIMPLAALAPAIEQQSREVAGLDSRIRELADDIREIASGTGRSGELLQGATREVSVLAQTLAASAVETATTIRQAVEPVAEAQIRVVENTIEIRNYLVSVTRTEAQRSDEAARRQAEAFDLLARQVESVSGMLSATVSTANQLIRDFQEQEGRILASQQQLVDAAHDWLQEVKQTRSTHGDGQVFGGPQVPNETPSGPGSWT